MYSVQMYNCDFRNLFNLVCTVYRCTTVISGTCLTWSTASTSGRGGQPGMYPGQSRASRAFFAASSGGFNYIYWRNQSGCQKDKNVGFLPFILRSQSYYVMQSYQLTVHFNSAFLGCSFGFRATVFFFNFLFRCFASLMLSEAS